MVEVIGVIFRKNAKIYYFAPGNNRFSKGESVIVETSRGVELGTVSFGNKKVDEKTIVAPLKQVMRKASEIDKRTDEQNRIREKDAFKICEEKIQKHKLDMKLVDVDYTFDGGKILFYFTADGRVDFRELVKDLAASFRTRIELRQIGVRDESKMLGGLGICGQPYCCSRFLPDFQPVSIKMAKEQGLSLNPTKISGSCGRLMCCLKYEEEAYEELIKNSPRIGAIVRTPDGEGNVCELGLLKGTLKVILKKEPDGAPHLYNVKDVSVIKDGPFHGKNDKKDKAEEELKELE